MTAIVLFCWLATPLYPYTCEHHAVYFDPHLHINMRETCERWIEHKEVEVQRDGGFLSHGLCVHGEHTFPGRLVSVARDQIVIGTVSPNE